VCVCAHAAGCDLKGTHVCLQIHMLPHGAGRLRADFTSHIKINSETGTDSVTGKVHSISL
jgi:hypothetical protein